MDRVWPDLTLAFAWNAGWLLRMATNDKGAEPFVAIHNAMLKVLQVGTCYLTCMCDC